MVLITIRFTRMHSRVGGVPLTPGIISYCRYYLKFLRDQRGVGEMKTGHVKMLSLLFTRRQRQFRRCGVLLRTGPTLWGLRGDSIAYALRDTRRSICFIDFATNSRLILIITRQKEQWIDSRFYVRQTSFFRLVSLC